MKKFNYKILVYLIIIPSLIILLFESGCHILNIPKISHNNIKSKSQELIPKIDSNTILFLGDSRIEYGIKPEIIKQKLINNKDLKVINLAFPGSNGLDIMSHLKANSIKPKLIILGFTPNYGRYDNHSFDKTIYSKRNKIEEHIKYFLTQKSFLYDTNSIKEYIKGKYPYFKSHLYDNWGGVIVTNHGNYAQRKLIQNNLYNEWSNSFNKESLNDYYSSIVRYKKWFGKHNIKLLGLYMPVSNEIFELEKNNYDSLYVKEVFDENYYNYSNIYNNSGKMDSLYFYDGSHLTPQTAISFSNELTVELQKQL